MLVSTHILRGFYVRAAHSPYFRARRHMHPYTGALLSSRVRLVFVRDPSTLPEA